MYNRYIRNDNGEYERIPVGQPTSAPPPPRGEPGRNAPPHGQHQEQRNHRQAQDHHRQELRDHQPQDHHQEEPWSGRQPQDHHQEASWNGPQPQGNHRQENSHTTGGRDKKGFLSSLLGRLKLDEIDTGDLLLLVILFLLFKESEDEELLIALGLLLIL